MVSVRALQKSRREHPSPPAPQPGIWRAGVIVLAGALAYSNSLAGPFIFDDRLTIVDNQSIRRLWPVGPVFNPERELPTAGRPLVNLSFAINYATGALSVRGYHLVNVVCHLLSALLVFGIVRRTLDHWSARGDRRSTLASERREAPSQPAANLAFAATLLWTVHPLNTEAVDYLTQRTELMMAFFYLLTLYAAIRAWGSPVHRSRTTPRSRLAVWNLVALWSCAAGMTCKESMATAPVIVVLYDVVFLFGSAREAFRARWRLYIGLALSWIALALVSWSGPRAHSAGFASGVDPWTYLVNQTLMLTRYARLAIWPRALVFNYGWPLPLTLGDVVPAALFIGSLLVLTLFALLRMPSWGFLGAWFFVTLAPTSSIVPIATEVGAERRMYLPLIAIVVLAVVGVSFVRRLGSVGATTLLVVVSAALAAGTLARNRDYTSGLQLARTVVARYPTSIGHHALGVELLLAAQPDEGIAELRQALAGAPRAHYELGQELYREGRIDEAIGELRSFVEKQPMLLEAVSARQLLGEALAQKKQWRQAIEQFQMVLTMNPSASQRVDTTGLLAAALFAERRFEEAIDRYREYLELRPADQIGVTHLGIALVATNRLDEAIAVFRRAVDLDPANSESQRRLALALFDHRDVAEASAHAERAVALRPNDAAAHELLGRTLAVQGRLTGAKAEFDRARQIDPDNADVPEDLRKLKKLAGDLVR